MTPQAVGQTMVIVSFIVWSAAWIGLVVIGWVATHNHQRAAAFTASALATALCVAGVTAMYQIPGSTQ